MELLDEIWRLIFIEHLDLLDTVRCRRVSKRFKSLVDQLRPTELLVYGHKCSYSIDFSHKDGRSPSHWIQLYRLRLKWNSSFQIVFANLRVLELNIELEERSKGERDEFHLELLNEFVRLEELYVNKLTIYRNQTLRLPYLKVLSIELHSKDDLKENSVSRQERIYRQQPRLVLDSTVWKLSCEQTTLLDIKHPEYVECFKCSASDLEVKAMNRFKKLRVLQILHSKLPESKLSIIESLKSLEELHVGLPMKEKEPLLKQMMARRAALGKEMKIYVADVCLPSDEPLGTSIDLHEDPLKFRIQHYHRLPDCVGEVKEIYYERLISWLDTLMPNRIELDEWRFPVGFFRKFPNIQSVYLGNAAEDEERFLYFLSRCSRITKLCFAREHLTQSILDRLPVVCGQLKVLSVFYTRGPSSGLDLRPVYKLKQLFVLEISSRDAHPDSTLNLLVLFRSCRYLVEVSLRHIQIVKRKGYHVLTPRESDLTANNAVCLNAPANFKYGDLEWRLRGIVRNCKELRKRTPSHPIW